VVISIANTPTKSTPNTKTEEPKTSTTKYIFLIIGFFIVVLWLLLLTNLASVAGITDLVTFKENIRLFVYLSTVFFILGIVFNYWVKDKYSEWASNETSSTKIVESHTLLPKIREYGLVHYNLCLGECLKIQGLMPYKEAGSVPPTRYFLFENIEYDEVAGHSIWVVNYFKTVNIHLFKRIHIGRDSNQKYWTGEFRNEQHQGLIDTSATKKRKDAKNIEAEDENWNSATEEK